MVVLIATGYDEELDKTHKPEVHVIESNMHCYRNGESKPMLQHLTDDYEDNKYIKYTFRVLDKYEIREEPKKTFENLSMWDFKKLLDYI